MLIPGLSANWVNQHTLKSAIPAPTVAPDTNLNNVREVGQRFTFRGRNYSVIEKDDYTWGFAEEACHPLTSFYRAVVDRIKDGTVQSRETQLANLLLDHGNPDRTVTVIRKESELGALQFGQRFNFDGRNYTVKRNLQGQWRAVEDESHPLHSFFCGITDRIEDLSFFSREYRFSQLLDNPAMPLTRIQRQRDFYKINQPGDRFNFKGRNYVVTINANQKWRIKEESCHPLYSFFVGILDRFADFSLWSRESRLAHIVIDPKYRSFQTDLNGTLWYVAVNKEHIHPSLHRHFYEERIVRGQEETTVLVSKDLLEFLGEQYRSGAKINVASTGKTSAREKESEGTLDNLFTRHGIAEQDFGFMAGKDFTAQADRRGVWFRCAFLKYQILGKWDGDRHNILIDDCWYQRWTSWFHTIDADEFFCMGSIDRLMRLSARLYAESGMPDPRLAAQPS